MAVVWASVSAHNYTGSLRPPLFVCVWVVRGCKITSVPLSCCCMPLSLCSVIDPDKLLPELLILWSESLMLCLRAGLTCRQNCCLPLKGNHGTDTQNTHAYSCTCMCTYTHRTLADVVDTPLGWSDRKVDDMHSTIKNMLIFTLSVHLSLWAPWMDVIGGPHGCGCWDYHGRLDRQKTWQIKLKK